MTPETAAALLELCAIIEGWPGAPAKWDMAKLKERLRVKAEEEGQWLCGKCGCLNGVFRSKCDRCGVDYVSSL